MSLMLRQQERGRGKQVTAIHVKDPSKDTANSKIDFTNEIHMARSHVYRCLFAFH